jgi:hypothetical protein
MVVARWPVDCVVILLVNVNFVSEVFIFWSVFVGVNKMLNEYSLDQHVYVFICYNNKYKYISKR